MRSTDSFLRSLLAAVVLVSICPFVRATDRTWNGSVGTSWTNNQNWSPLGSPGAGENAVVANFVPSGGNSFTVNYDYAGAPITLGTVYLSADSNNSTPSAATLFISSGTLSAATENIGAYTTYSQSSMTPTNGQGIVNQSGGINNAGNLTLGYQQGYGAGFYNLSGGATLNVSGPEKIGQILSNSSAFTQTGGSHSIGSDLVDSGNFSLSGGTLTVAITEALSAGQFIQTGGTNTTTILRVGAMQFGGFIGLPGAGTFGISAGSVNATSYLEVGGDDSYMIIGGTNYVASPGLMTISGTGQVTTPTTYIEALGDLELTGGTLTTGSISIASDQSNTGVFNWSAGALVIPGSTTFDPSATTTIGGFFGNNLNLRDGKILRVAGSETLGGTGAFTMTIGSGGVDIVKSTLNLPTKGFCSLGSGGTLITSAINENGALALFRWTGGTLSLTSAVTFNPAAAVTDTGSIFSNALTLSGTKSLLTLSETLTSTDRAKTFALTVGTGGSNIVNGPLTVGSLGSLTISGGSVIANSISVTSGGKILFSSGSFAPGTLNLTSGGSVTLAAPAQTLTLDTLTLDSSSRLDTGSASFIVHSGDLSKLRTSLLSGYNNGAWAGGTGIYSSSIVTTSPIGIGFALNTDTVGNAIFVSFNGIAVAKTDTLVALTYFGDADLSKTITANDYGHIDSGYQNQHGVGFVFDWFNGDFDYNGVINANDYALIDSSYQLQSGTLRAALDYLETGVVPTGQVPDSLQEVINHNAQFGADYANAFVFANVPEPTMLSLAVLTLTLATRRSRR